MKNIITKYVNAIKYWLIVLFLWLWFFPGWFSNADDLLREVIEPSYYNETIIWLGKNIKTVWNNVMLWSTELDFSIKKEVKTDDNGNPVCKWGSCSKECQTVSNSNKSVCKHQWKYSYFHIKAEKEQPMIVKITRFLLILTITLAVTMILYNGMIYIIQTWQWKDSKDLTKNIIYIVIWILVALFSVVIITLIQSVPSTLWDKKELPTNTYEHDQDKGISFQNIL